jgi:AcrR family transcriptional regulator
MFPDLIFMRMIIQDAEGGTKVDTIINAAQKRFGIYGVEKTTMKEIADDLHMSKAALYYYFPDKEDLYAMVVEKEQAEFLKIIEKDFGTSHDPARNLKKYALTRLAYFRKLLSISRIRQTSFGELKPRIATLMIRFREKEKEHIKKVLEEGVKDGQFNIDDPGNTAALFLDLLRGLRSAFIAEKDLLIIDETEYQLLSDKVKEITDIFINGLMCK